MNKITFKSIPEMNEWGGVHYHKIAYYTKRIRNRRTKI